MITTEFAGCLQPTGCMIFLGCFQEMPEREAWHILVEKPPVEMVYLQDIIRTLKGMEGTLNVVSSRSSRSRRPAKVMFLVHNMATWDSIADVHNEMAGHPDFEVIVASIPRRFPGERHFSHEDETHAALDAAGIAHIRFHAGSNDILKAIGPDAIFRQSPWDYDIPDEFSTQALSFSNLIYIPYYGFNLLEHFTSDRNAPDSYSDLEFHRACTRIYCESDLTREMMSRRSRRGSDNMVATGHPKLERLRDCVNTPSWPVRCAAASRRPARLIWAPHHSINGDGWLGFGTFRQTYRAMLEWAREDSDIEMVLRPHPALFTNLIGSGMMTESELDAFRSDWAALPNTAESDNGDYGELFSASDLMITEGISFLAEYLMFPEKPIIFLDSGHHAPFNQIGKMVADAAYVVSNVPDALKVTIDYLVRGDDPKKGAREAAFGQLIPASPGASRRIVQNLHELLLDGFS
ncbi:hypothetical protein [Acetobacter oeni]|uniref:CDP-Glycerol:Poly(Glycerophosphate) glycerophosphotransferase n=1 Tax=Acetobacter oeni TaxID=304077 RepID=A0A511XM57_9PROT|nr:hypothetical protein [Acetobacter oeni]NHO20016.1 hypothetical protein [Acetobacter oeni]GBR04555.1 hypothetical protein AA21952_1465 [Acetobacter oeni LMG 21952]GEN64024.1 hypothetical protein AOE01nite_22480 [Acetobacter oeni]